MRRIAALLALLSSFTTVASAATVAIAPSKDNTLYQQASGTLSNGAGSFFFAGTTAASEIRRGLIAFDVAGSVPAGSTITGATLRLHLSLTTSGAQTIGLRRVSADWGEGTSDAVGGEGGGAPSTAGDATWIHRFFNTTNWSAAGGDFAGSASATVSVVDTTFYTWSGAGMVADVQQWLDAPSGNFGWGLVGNEAVASTSKRFDSRQNVVTVVRPVLTVDYIPAVPAVPAPALFLLSLAMLGVAVFALRKRLGTV